jgi:hypothetical protein
MDQEKQVSRQARLFGGSAPWDEIHVELEALPKPTLSLEAMEELIQEVELTSDKVTSMSGPMGAATPSNSHQSMDAVQSRLIWSFLDWLPHGKR